MYHYLTKEEVAEQGYIDGRYVTGEGHAHECCEPHTLIFNCPMIGTFNVRMRKVRVDYFEPSLVSEKKSYWFVKITKAGQYWYGWAVRDHGSKQKFVTLEILTKKKLPKILKKENFKIYIYEKWSKEEIKRWAEDKYWFQTFPFSPRSRADSSFVWDTINIVEWSGKKVLDIGCHYGFHSFKASEAGAKVVGVDTDQKCLDIAKTIQENIYHQDVEFVKRIPPVEQKFDIVMYLSVHHQDDPNYKFLKVKINELKERTLGHLFVELIIPPTFPLNKKLSEHAIDTIVGGKVLAKYKHKVRGYRKIYWIKNDKT